MGDYKQEVIFPEHCKDVNHVRKNKKWYNNWRLLQKQVRLFSQVKKWISNEKHLPNSYPNMAFFFFFLFSFLILSLEACSNKELTTRNNSSTNISWNKQYSRARETISMKHALTHTHLCIEKEKRSCKRRVYVRAMRGPWTLTFIFCDQKFNMLTMVAKDQDD